MASREAAREEEVQEGQDEVSGPMLVSVLESAGIAHTDIKKLQEAGFNTVESVAYSTKKVLLNVKGL